MSGDLKDSGAIVNTGTGLCLDTRQDDTKGTAVVQRTCDGSIPQRWFFSRAQGVSSSRVG